MPELPKKITIDLKAKKVYIDGAEFPWFIAEEGVRIEHVMAHQLPVVYLPVIAEDVEIVPES